MGNRGWGSAMKINPRAARVANFADAEQQAVLIQNLENGGAQHIGSFVVTETHHADNEQYLGRTLQSIADEQGVEVGRVLIEQCWVDAQRRMIQIGEHLANAYHLVQQARA